MDGLKHSFLPVANEGQVFVGSGWRSLKIQSRFSRHMIMSHESMARPQGSLSSGEARHDICAGVYSIYP